MSSGPQVSSTKDASLALSSLHFESPLCSFQAAKQQQPVLASNSETNSAVTILSTPTSDLVSCVSISASSRDSADTLSSPLTSPIDVYSTPKSKQENLTQKQTQEMLSPSPICAVGKRNRFDDNLPLSLGRTHSKRKAGSDYLRKGQWTSTEERLTRLLIEAFEEGSLPIYTGIRLRGYLAVQLQCDPMRVSKKLCAGTIDGKQMPKNYGQKKFKLRKKSFWDSGEAGSRIAELKRLTKALWSEARMRKPAFLTLSSTHNLNKRRGFDDDDDLLSSPSSPVGSRSPSTTPKFKKQKVLPIIYLNLSELKRYSVKDGSSSEPTSPSKNPDSDSEPVRLDGESLQAAYDLLTLCSPRGSSSTDKRKKGKFKKGIAKKTFLPKDASSKVDSNEWKRKQSLNSTSESFQGELNEELQR